MSLAHGMRPGRKPIRRCKVNPELRRAIRDAGLQLNKSERGRRVKAELRALFENGGYGLDSQNMIALCIIVEAVRVGERDAVRDALHPQSP